MQSEQWKQTLARPIPTWLVSTNTAGSVSADLLFTIPGDTDRRVEFAAFATHDLQPTAPSGINDAKKTCGFYFRKPMYHGMARAMPA